MVTDEAGWKIAAHDYYPFGMETTSDDGAGSRRRFTGHERDAVTGLDYMLARYGVYQLARLLSVDPSVHRMALADPQSMKRCKWFCADAYRDAGADDYPRSKYPAANGGPALTEEFRRAAERLEPFKRISESELSVGDLVVFGPRRDRDEQLGHMGIVTGFWHGDPVITSARASYDGRIKSNTLSRYREESFDEIHYFTYAPDDGWRGVCGGISRTCCFALAGHFRI